MNRKQRRATRKHSPSAGISGGSSDPARQLLDEAVRYQREQKPDNAVQAYRRLLSLRHDHAQANNDLACVLQTQGRLREASEHFARALSLMPQLFDAFTGVCATLVSVLPPIGEAMRRAAEVWPKPLPADQLFGRTNGLADIADDPLLLCILQTTPVREFALERVLTLLRAALLADAATGAECAKPILAFCCALAKQCFINEYIFATTSEEDAQVDRLQRTLDNAITSGADIAPLTLAALAMYLPLHTLTDAQTLLTRNWPSALDAVITQQLREPNDERALRSRISRLTEIDDAISQRVREQYEESPYPRWVHIAGNVEPTDIEQYLHDVFPATPIVPRANMAALDVLVAGCGTGWQAIGVAQKFNNAHVLAVDLSLSSLAYAIRKTPPPFAGRIDYAQADILKFGTSDRTFDLIEASGVLHHMADPFEGWRILLALLRPSGIMHLGLYSELARRHVVAVRSFIAERGYGSTPAEIRRCRQDLINSPMRGVARFNDFFTTSECRDLLFHVQETRVAILAIEDFLKRHALRFLGFEFDAATMAKYRALFAERSWSLTDLGRWHDLETAYPDTFANMYQFWVQKK